MNRQWNGVAVGIAGLLFIGTGAAEECVVSEDREAGVIIIGTAAGREFRALTDEGKRAVLRQATELKAANAELQRARAEIEELRKQLAAREQIQTGAEGLVEKQKQYIGDLEQSLSGYRSLAEDYRKLSRGPGTLTFEAGIGATGGDTNPALLVGVGVRRLRVWGFFQENNSGALVGIQYPLF